MVDTLSTARQLEHATGIQPVEDCARSDRGSEPETNPVGRGVDFTVHLFVSVLVVP